MKARGSAGGACGRGARAPRRAVVLCGALPAQAGHQSARAAAEPHRKAGAQRQLRGRRRGTAACRCSVPSPTPPPSTMPSSATATAQPKQVLYIFGCAIGVFFWLIALPCAFGDAAVSRRRKVWGDWRGRRGGAGQEGLAPESRGASRRRVLCGSGSVTVQPGGSSPCVRLGTVHPPSAPLTPVLPGCRPTRRRRRRR